MKPRPRALVLAAALACAFVPFARAAEAGGIQFRSVLIDGQSQMFSLADATGAGQWKQIGESFEGWKLESFDAAAQKLILRRDGETRELTLDSARVADADASAAPGSVAEADALLQRMRFEDMIAKSIEAQQAAMAKSLGGMMGKNATDADRARMAEFQKKAAELMIAEMDLPGMRQELAQVYADTFSSAELKAQADFYSTSAGQALIDKQPALQQRMMELMMPRMMKAMPKLQTLAREQREAAAPTPAPAAPATTAP